MRLFFFDPNVLYVLDSKYPSQNTSIYKNTALNTNIIKAEKHADTGKVTTHDRAIFRNIRQSTPSPDFTDPTATTDPTRQCVVEIGRPSLEATKAVTAAPNSIVNPEAGLISDIR
jgi:hypothetical protein